MTLRNAILCASSLGTLALGAAPAGAAPEMRRTPSVEVQIRDLNLVSQDGRTRLDSRIRRAARQSCGYGGPGVAADRADGLCRAVAINDARAQAAPLIEAAKRGAFDRVAGNSISVAAR